MVGWVSISRIKWILRNMIEPKLLDPTAHACLVVDSDGAGIIYCSKEDKSIETILSFHSQDELDSIFDDLQHYRAEIQFDEKTKKFCIVKIKQPAQNVTGDEKAKHKGHSLENTGGSNPGDTFFGL